MNDNFGRTSLIRHIYRGLLNNGRTYAAFEDAQAYPLAEELAERGEIFDPTAGYGTLIKYCSRLNISAFCMEYNPPAYYWEVLIHPAYSEFFICLSEELISSERQWPQNKIKASICADWFHPESKGIINHLLLICNHIARKIIPESIKTDSKELALAFVLPFVGRLSNSIPGNVTAHVKQGGVCIYEGWQEDFKAYLCMLRKRLQSILKESRSIQHEVMFGDCSNAVLPRERFRAMLTSPPYPNGRDYYAMFGPENACLEWLLADNKALNRTTNIKHLIGSVYVSSIGQKNGGRVSKVRSLNANRFLKYIEDFKGSARAKYDNKIYYLPYFSNYFSAIEKAYENVSKSLTKDFVGYIVVVNNTARNQVVPVAESVLDTWRALGFNAEIVANKTRETSHFGSINPRAKGFRSRHLEYTIRIRRK